MRKNLVFLTVLLFSLLKYSDTFAQTDTLFWFVAPEVTANHEDDPVRFKISSFGQSSTVTISMPANPGFTPIVQVVAANTMETVDMTAFKDIIENRLVENQLSDDTLNRGILIQATTPITIYYEIGDNFNRDIYALKGNNGLGLDFIIPMQNRYPNQATWYDGYARNGFDIVSTEDNNQIEIILTAGVGWAAAVPDVREYIKYQVTRATTNCNPVVKWTRVQQHFQQGVACTGPQNWEGCNYNAIFWEFSDTLEGTSANDWTEPSNWVAKGKSDTVWNYKQGVTGTYVVYTPGAIHADTWAPYRVDTKVQLSAAVTNATVWEFTDTSEITKASSTLPPDSDPWTALGRSDTTWFINPNTCDGYSPNVTLLTPTSSYVVITPGNPAGEKYSAGDTIRVTLNKGETYSVISSSKAAAAHLTGSRVKSTKKVAISLKDDSVDMYNGGTVCNDLVGDQIVPVDIVGTDYIAIKGQIANSPDIEGVFVTATEDATDISIGGMMATTINAGQTFFIPMLDATPEIFIKTSKPSYAYQLTGTGCEAAGALLPPIICTGSKEVAFTRTTTETFFVILLAPKAIINDFTLSVNNAAPIAIPSTNFKVVPGNDNFMAAQISYDAATIPINTQCVIANPKGLFHMGFTNGGSATGAMYGYFSNYGASTSGSTAQIRYPGCDVVLEGPIGGSTYTWSTGATTPSINIGQITKDTTVWVVSDKGLCGDSTYYTISPVEPKAGFNVDMCLTADTSFIANVANEIFDSLAWYRSPDFTTVVSTDSIVKLDSIGIYGVIFYYKGCASDTNFFDIKLEMTPTVLMPNDTAICPGSPLVYTAKGSASNISYAWTSSPAGFTGNTAQVTIPTAVAATTTYTVVVTSPMCGFTGSDNIVVTIPGVKVATNTNTLYTGCSTTLTAPSGKTDYTWSTNPATDTLSTILLDILSDTIVKVWYFSDTLKCAADTTIFDIHPFMPQAGDSADVCAGGTHTIRIKDYIPDPTNVYDSFAWFDVPSGGSSVSTVDSIVYTSSDTLWLELYFKGCTSIRYPYKVLILPMPTVDVGVDDTVCLGAPSISKTVISTNPRFKYHWSTNPANDYSLTTILPTNVAGIAHYTVTVTDTLCGFTGSDDLAINVLGFTSTTSSDTLYTGCSTTLTALDVNQQDYHWSTGQTTTSVTLPLTKDTIVSVYYKTALNVKFNCAADTNIFVIHPFMPDAAFDSSICGSTAAAIDFDVSKEKFDSLKWFSLPNTLVAYSTSPTLTMTQQDTLALVFYYKNCVSDTNYFRLVLSEIPTVDAGIDTTVCLNTVLTYNANGSDPSITYKWASNPAGFTANTQSITIPTSVGGTVTYLVTVTSPTCGFTGTDDLVVTVLAPTTKTESSDIYVGCNGKIHAPAGYTSYKWSHTAVNDSVVDVNVNTSVTDVKVYYNQNKCTADTSFFKLIPIEPTAGKTDSLCTGKDLDLDVSDQKFDSLRWYNGSADHVGFSTNPKVTITKTGNYYVKFYYKGCAAEEKEYLFKIVIVPDPVVQILDKDVCVDYTIGRSVDLHATVKPAGTPLEWSTGSKDSVITVTKSGDYSITATNKCAATDVATIKVTNCPIKVPNAFTPNGDGVNDIFWINDVEKSVWQVVIYNRWGNKVFETDHYLNTPSDGWDGGNASDGVYYWVITNAITGERYENGENGTGFVHVIRDEK